MAAVKILDAGGNLLLSGSDEADVAASLQKYVGRGASVISPPSQLGSSWVAACTAPPKVPGADETMTLRLSDIVAATTKKPEAERRTLGAAQYVEAGHAILISGPTEAAVRAALDAFAQQGARPTSEPTRIGPTWVASCERTGSADACTVEEFGLKRIVTGPSAEAVSAKVDELAAAGGLELVGDIEEQDGQWVAILDSVAG